MLIIFFVYTVYWITTGKQRPLSKQTPEIYFYSVSLQSIELLKFDICSIVWTLFVC